MAIPTWRTELKELRPGIYAYIQEKGNWGLSNSGAIVGHRGVLLIDTLFTNDLTRTMLAEIASVTALPVTWLYYTHHHGDHVYGSGLIPSATVVAHEQCARILSAYPPDPAVTQQRFPQFDFSGVEVRLPQLTFSGGLTHRFDGYQVEFIHHCHAHTPGDAVVYLPDHGIVFCGDVLFLYSTPVAQDGSIRGWLRFLEFLLDLPAQTYIPGHGPVTDRQGVLLCYEYLASLYVQGRKFHEMGVPPAEAARRFELGVFREWANWERVLINLHRLYAELEGKSSEEAPINLSALRPELEALAAGG